MHLHKERLLWRGTPRSLSVSLPDSWEQMTHSDIMYAIDMLYNYKSDYAHACIVLHLLKKSSVHSEIRHLKSEILLDLADTLSWMDSVYIMPEGNERYTGVPFTHFTHAGITYHLPEREMMNSTAKEYIMAEEYFKSEKPDNALLMIATLCRPASKKKRKPGEDPRVKIKTREEIEARAQALKDLPQSIQVLIIFFYEEAHRFVFSLGKDLIFSSSGGGSTKGGPMFGWWSVLMDLAKSGAFGTFEQVQETNIIDIVMYLCQEKQRYLDEKAELDRIAASHKVHR